VRHKFTPIKGAREISLIYVDSFDRAHCLTDQSVYFVCNPYQQEILYQQDLSSWGRVIREGFVYDITSKTLFCLLSKTLLKIEISKEKVYEPKVVQRLVREASSGIVFYNKQIFYGSGSHLCSIQTEK
jgi:hypothetical protein